jgi:hypothetical protein
MDEDVFKLKGGEKSIRQMSYQCRIRRECAWKRFGVVAGDNPKMLSGKGKYDLLNYKGLKEAYDLAKEQCPIAADAILVLMWDAGINFNTLEFLAKDVEERPVEDDK